MNRTTPDLKLLRVFVSVVQHQGFAAAQEELGLTASAISNYMSQLERQLAIALCHRGRSGFRLTSKGEIYYAECVRVLAELDEFDKFGALLGSELRGTLTVGVLDSIVTESAFPLTEVIAEFCSTNPGVHLELRVRTPSDLQASVLEERIDVGIGSFLTRMTGLSYQALYREQQWLYCSNLHPMFEARPTPEDNVTRQPMVTRSYWTDAELSRQGFKDAAGTIDNMEAQLIMILSGRYIGYLPEHYASPWVNSGKLRPLLPSIFGYQAQFSLVLRRGRSREPLVQAFREALRR